ncbi:uncharacterized protein LOC111701134 [Eurytemora carolleeae]|uniref:uncharacterized protein LOC111701134 n=1 Tax=Eurytemora carolleeae TaxID=1294199 RepID=UPI000C76CEFA|nr:uncharacterized protein LOC111701134 [Eurytemora carolleeae]|eukprot:XP_023328066.1 uncharacterized protein LOC111701134 [Eurytemora affinis]
MDHVTRPVLRCKDKKCSFGVWWEESCSCVQQENEVFDLCSCVQQENEGRDGFGLSPCGDEGYTLLINPYGAGVCTCQDGYILDQDQKCAKDTEGALTRFIDLRKDLQEAGHANIENCFLVNNGICTKTIKSEMDLDSSSRNSLAELVNWLGSFPHPAQQCTGEKREEGENEEHQEEQKREEDESEEDEDERGDEEDEDESGDDEDESGIIAKFGFHSLDCSQDNEVEYNGECVKIFSSSVCPNQTQWVVMKKEKNTLEAVCQEKPCKNDEIFYQKDCKCHGVDSDACGLNEDLYINIYGYGMCTCKPNHAVHAGDGKCYPIYSTGPCSAGSMFVPSTDLSGTCKPTVCIEGKVYLNAGVNEDPENVNDPDSDINCFAIGDSEPCADDKKVGIDEKFEITCIEDSRLNPSNQNEEGIKAFNISPTTCILDSRGRCRR